MNGNCHFVFGAAVGAMCVLNLALINANLPNIAPTPETATLFVLGGITGGIFPDIDNSDSHIGKLSVPVSTCITAVGGLFGKKGQHHRGILHDPIVYILGLVLSYLYFSPLVGFFIGCISHIFLDLFNPAGVPFLFGVKHLHLGKIKSGSRESVLFTWVSVFLVLAAGFALRFGISV